MSHFAYIIPVNIPLFNVLTALSSVRSVTVHKKKARNIPIYLVGELNISFRAR
jgi:hypothetical protein